MDDRRFGALFDIETCAELSEMHRACPDDFDTILGAFFSWISTGANDEQEAMNMVKNPLARAYLSKLLTAHRKRGKAYFDRRKKYTKTRGNDAPADGAHDTPSADESTLQAPVSLEVAKSHAGTHFTNPRPTPEWVEYWYSRMTESGWRDKRGKPLTNGRWQREMSAWWQQEQKPKASPGAPSGVTGGYVDTSTMNYND